MTIAVPLDGGRSTTACLYEAEQPHSTLLVLAHGAGAGQGHPFMVTAATGLAARGIDVVTFDFPYMHDHRRLPDRAPVLEGCFRGVVAHVRAGAALAAHRLFIGGKSMGGRMATHLGAQGLPALLGIVVLGYPLHPPGKAQLRAAHLPAVTVPILVVQGERDAFGTPAELAPVLETMPAGAALHVLPGADHSLSVKGRKGPSPDGAVLDAIAAWLVR